MLLVKLADRLHNMRTMAHAAGSAPRRPRETMDIYAPLAGRIGMHDMRDELENLAFRELNPDAHKVITERLETLAARSKRLDHRDRGAARPKLADSRHHGRGQRPPQARLFDLAQDGAQGGRLRAALRHFRLPRHRRQPCRMLPGARHRPHHLAGRSRRFKDYISTPKHNDYRSIHTTVIGPGKQRVELQIRTEEMDEIAEYGIAAHALYKDEPARRTRCCRANSNAYAWLRRTIELLAEGSNPEEFLEHTKLELFHDQVFCFTPKGKLIALPRGATPIDFAYAVHTDVGNRRSAPRSTARSPRWPRPLQNGDEVEILTSKAQAAPPAAWESLVVTGKARAAMRRATRHAVRAQYARLAGASSSASASAPSAIIPTRA